MNKAVIVGGAGFIGSHVVEQIINSDLIWDEILVIDNLSTGKIENIHPKCKLILADIRNYQEIEPYFKDAKYVWHLAALTQVESSIQDPLLYNDINVNGTLNVFLASKKHNVKRIIFSSSSSVYGQPIEIPTSEASKLNPLSPYALQKLHCEQYANIFCDLYGMNITCLRYFNVYGNRSSDKGSYAPVINIWLRQIKENKKITITGDGKQTRDFISVLDVAKANYVTAMFAPFGFNVYNVGSGKQYELNEIARWICNDEKNIEYIAPRIEPRKSCSDITKILEMSNNEFSISHSLKDYIHEKLKIISLNKNNI